MLWHLTASNQFVSASMDSGERQTFWPEIGNNTAKENFSMLRQVALGLRGAIRAKQRRRVRDAWNAATPCDFS
jgi:hypothetical protein